MVMDLATLHRALSDYFGCNAEIESPEDETEAWKAIVAECRDGSYIGLLQELDRLLARTDVEIFEYLRLCAPAWKCDSPAEARHGLMVFQS